MVVVIPYLWQWEAEGGYDSGAKLRPCVVVDAADLEVGQRIVVCPVTHKPNFRDPFVEIPKGYLHDAGLDGRGCYVIPSEVNVFEYPAKGTAITMSLRGRLPDGFMMILQREMERYRKAKFFSEVDRDRIAREIVRDHYERRR